MDETIIVDPNDEEIAQDDALDEFAAYFSGDKTPKILITSSVNPSKVRIACIHYNQKLIILLGRSRVYSRVADRVPELRIQEAKEVSFERDCSVLQKSRRIHRCHGHQ
jgi:hypothetical protein